MDRLRYLESSVREDLAEKMVFIAGPRQVGKTTLARRILASSESGAYSTGTTGAIEPRSEPDKYGRYLVELFADGQCVNDWLVANGHAIYQTYSLPT